MGISDADHECNSMLGPNREHHAVGKGHRPQYGRCHISVLNYVLCHDGVPIGTLFGVGS